MESWMFLAPCVCQAAAVRLDATLRQSACDMVAGESSFPLSSRRQLKLRTGTIAGGFPLAAEAMLPYPSQEWSEHMPSKTGGISEADLLLPTLIELANSPADWLSIRQLIEKLAVAVTPSEDAGIVEGRTDAQLSELVRDMVAN